MTETEENGDKGLCGVMSEELEPLLELWVLLFSEELDNPIKDAIVTTKPQRPELLLELLDMGGFIGPVIIPPVIVVFEDNEWLAEASIFEEEEEEEEEADDDDDDLTLWQYARIPSANCNNARTTLAAVAGSHCKKRAERNLVSRSPFRLESLLDKGCKGASADMISKTSFSLRGFGQPNALRREVASSMIDSPWLRESVFVFLLIDSFGFKTTVTI